ncbi:MAG TPA: hypothetical protein VKA46_39435 [Gemmataceae bacterium]|nr:hypothetical protein [Gemmataceae bacterium]
MSKKSCAAVVVSGVLAVAATSAASYFAYLHYYAKPETVVSTGGAGRVAEPPKPGTPSDLCQRLQGECAKGELKGVWLSSGEVRDGQLVLHGVVDRAGQTPLVEAKANEILPQVGDLKEQCTGGVNTTDLKVMSVRGKVAEVEKNWSEDGPHDNNPAEEAKRQVRRQTRLEDAYFVYPNQLHVTGLSLAAEGDVVVGQLVEIDVGKQVRQGASGSLKQLEVVAKIERKDNPALKLQEAADKGGLAGVALDNAWFDGQGTLQISGLLAREDQRAALEALVKGQFEKGWAEEKLLRAEGARGWSAQGMQVLDTSGLTKTLQAQLAKGKSPLRRETRLDGASLVRDPFLGLQLHLRGVCIAEQLKGDEQKARRSLQEELAKVVHEAYPQAALRVAIPNGITLKPDLVHDLKKDVKLGLTAFIKEVGFTDSGEVFVRGLGLTDENKKQLLELAQQKVGPATTKAVPPGPPQEEEEEAGAEEEEQEPPLAAKPAEERKGLLGIADRLQKDLAADPKWRHVRIDKLAPPEKKEEKREGKDVTVWIFPVSGVWLHAAPRTEDEKKQAEEVDRQFRAKLQELGKRAYEKQNQIENPDDTGGDDEVTFDPAGIRKLESPLTALRAEAVGREGLRGVVFDDACYDAGRKFQLKGYAGGKEQRDQVAAALKEKGVLEAGVLYEEGGKPAEADLSGLQDLKYEDIRTAAQKEFSASPAGSLQTQTRLDDVAFIYVKDNMAVNLVLSWRGHSLQASKDKEEQKQAQAKLEADLKKVAEAHLPKPVPAYSGLDLTKLTVSESPIVTLREKAVGNDAFRGAVFDDASYDAEGKLRLKGYVGSTEQKKSVADLMAEADFLAAGILREADGKRVPPDLSDMRTVEYAPLRKKVQEQFAAQPAGGLLAQTRLDDVAFVYVKDKMGVPSLVLSWRGRALQGSKDEKKRDEARAQLKAELEKATKALLPKPVPTYAEVDVSGIALMDNPILLLQARAAKDPALAGVLFEGARYDGGGRLELHVIATEDQGKGVEELAHELKDDPGVKIKPPEWAEKGVTWGQVVKKLQAKQAGGEDKLLQKTRLDRAFFTYDDESKVRLHFAGVCIQDGDRDALKKQLQEKLAELVKAEYPQLVRDTAVTLDPFEFKPFPVTAVQDASKANKELDGFLVQGARYDADGKLRLKSLGFKEDDDKVKAVLKEALKGTSIYAPEAPAKPAPKPDSKPDPEKKEKEPAARRAALAGVLIALIAGAPADSPRDDAIPYDPKALLKDLRTQFAADRKEPLVRQTRVDRAYFAYHDRDPIPYLHFQLVCLMPKGKEEDHRKRLGERLATFYKEALKERGADVEFKVDLSEASFVTDPTPGLQRYVASNYPTLDGVLFVAAWYDPDRRLNFDVIFDKAAGQEQRIKDDLFAAGTVGRRKLLEPPVLLPDSTPAKEPVLNPQTFVKWEAERQALQGKFARSREPLLERTRVDRLYFTYLGNDTSERQLKVEGVCLQPGPAAANQEKVGKGVEERWEPRFPGVTFRVVAEGGVAVLESPVVGLQTLAVGQDLDNVLFESAVYDADGKLHLRVYLADLAQAPRIDELLKTPAGDAASVKARRKGEDPELDKPRPFPWQEDGDGKAGLRERFQKGFAASDVRAAQQTRLDRVYFHYDKDEVRQLLLAGVSLWDGLPEATLSAALTPVCRAVLPGPGYQVVAEGPDRVARQPNPAPALQQQLVRDKEEFDGILFQDAGYDDIGRLRFDVLVNGSEAQQTEVRRLIEKAPLAPGVRPKEEYRSKVRLETHTFDWEAMMKSVRAWAAGASAPHDARQTRVDRAYFEREDGGCQLRLKGVTLMAAPEGDFDTRLKVWRRAEEAFRQPFLDHLRPLKLKIPPPGDPQMRATGSVAPTKRDLLTALRSVIPTQRPLDGVNVTDVVYDEKGRVALEGHWIGPDQGPDLEAVLKEALQTETKEHSRYGISLERLRVVRTDLLLRDLRRWIVDKTEVEEVLFDRLYFDAAGKLRIDGFFTRPDDKAPAEKAGLEGLLAYPIGRALLGLDPDGVVKPDIEGKDVIHLAKRASLVAYLRGEVPADPKLDGVRIDRCTYDAGAVFVLTGLEDGKEQSRGLKGMLDWAQESAAFKGHLADGWRRGKFTDVPMRRMLTCLRRLMPADALFDGMGLDRGYHDGDNHLVITGATIGPRRRDKAEKALAEMIEAEPDWRIRLSYGGPDLKIKLTPADLELGQRAFERAVEWFAHERNAARAVADLDTVLFHNPGDATAWYFRAVCYLAIKDEAAAKRDLRRVLGFAQGRPPLVDQVIAYDRLELVQGRYRATASQTAEKFSLALPAEKPLAAVLKELCEDPPRPVNPPDEAPGWSAAPSPPASPRAGAPCWLPR